MSAHLTFPKGGVHPPEAKELTEKLAVETMPLPAELELILGQHIGAPCAPVVKRKTPIARNPLTIEPYIFHQSLVRSDRLLGPLERHHHPLRSKRDHQGAIDQRLR